MTDGTKWWRIWAENLLAASVKSEQKGKGGLKRKKKGSVGVIIPRFIEIGLVADKQFMDSHKNRNPKEFILSLFNMAHSLWSDSSIGNVVDLVIVKSTFLKVKKPFVDPLRSQKPESMLSNFCKWQKHLNKNCADNPNHYDLAILITGGELCTNHCGVAGISYIGGVCLEEVNRNCNINQDLGLITGITIAHEIGHSMGAAHDSPDETGCLDKTPDGRSTVMSVYTSFAPEVWSSCSKEAVSMFLESDLGDCLLDEPKDVAQPLADILPGALYTPSEQCKLLFGKEYTYCDMGSPSEKCKKMWCRSPKETKCMTKNTPLVDGSPCAARKWCMARECVQQGERPNSVSGAWGDWGPWSGCSRSCGGGIGLRERLCDNPPPSRRGKYCTGPRIEYRTCNTHPCSDSSIRFRDAQCQTAAGKIPMYNKMRGWKAELPPNFENQHCKLWCSNENKEIIDFDMPVVDGTRCRPGSKDTCIQGVCVPVGCDWKIRSSAVEDACGICNGDGAHCKTNTTIYTSKKIGFGRACVIPKFSSVVRIRELKPCTNVIGVGPADRGTRYLNPGLEEQSSGEYLLGKVKAVYTKPEKGREEIYIKGPLVEDLQVWYLQYKSENPGLECKWVTMSEEPVRKPEYNWEFIEWERCSADCGGGTQISKAVCVEKKSGRVGSQYCLNLKKQRPISRECNTHRCPTYWKAWGWGPCTGCMYVMGKRYREVECVMKSSGEGSEEETIVPASECEGEPPARVENCYSSKPCKKDKSKGEETSVNEEDRTLTTSISFKDYNKDFEGLDKFLGKINKTGLARDKQVSRILSGTPVIDLLSPDYFTLARVNLSEDRGVPMRLTEEDYECEGDVIPIHFTKNPPVIWKGEKAKKFLMGVRHSRE